ncbi:MAG: hypothetical protein JW771_05265 [Candidatus Thermoplasmatota archaeon]|nr:hypothetical protein [Candidatus Thermoplasmatota archaeon]
MNDRRSDRPYSLLLILASIVSCIVLIYFVRRLVYAFGITYYNVEVGLLFDAIALPVIILTVGSILLLCFHKQKNSP